MRLNDDILGQNPGSWWKFLLGLVGVPIGYVLLLFLYGMIVGVLQSAGIMSYSTFQMLLGIDYSGSVEGLFFAFMLIGMFHPMLMAFIRFAYGRSYMSVINPFGADWKTPFVFGILYVFIFFLTLEILSIPFRSLSIDVSYVWQPKLWIIWLLPMAIVIFLQSSAEELFFRGFMQQYLARLIKPRWVYLVVPSVLWASLHWWNMDGFWLRVTATLSIFIMGIVFADWADITGSLWGPIAAHFANNFLLVCVYGNSLEPSEMMIWRGEFGSLSDNQIALSMFLGGIVIAVVYLLMRKRILTASRSSA